MTCAQQQQHNLPDLITAKYYNNVRDLNKLTSL